VFEQDQPTVRAQHAGDLPHHPSRVRHRAEDEGRGDGVEAVVVERQPLAPALDDLVVKRRR
jgi:hypothetical protein